MGLKFELTSEGYIGLAIVYDAAASKFPVHTTRKLNNFFHIILCLKSKKRNWIFNFSDYWSRGFKPDPNKLDRLYTLLQVNDYFFVFNMSLNLSIFVVFIKKVEVKIASISMILL